MRFLGSVPSAASSTASSSVSSIAGPVSLDRDAPSQGARRGPLSHPAILFLLAMAVLFAAYALGYIPQFGSLLEASVRSGESTAMPALSPVFYGVAGLVAFLMLLAALRSLDMLLRGTRMGSSFADRPVKPLAEFIEEAAAADLSVRVARESYHLLHPHYPQVMSIALTDRLRDDLRLEDEEIRLLNAKLLTRCDRRDPSPDATAADVSGVVTIFDLLHRVENAAPAQLDRPSGIRDRATDNLALPPVQKPVVLDPRNPTSAQRKAIHAAALNAIESRSLQIAQNSGLKRRRTDYEGPRRRATDNPANIPAYDGPYRRAGDQRTAFSGVSSSEHQAQFDPSTLTRLDPIFPPPRSGRSSADKSTG